LKMEQMKIYSAINSIMGEIGGIAKNKRNQAQGYSFRGIDDVYLAVQPLLAKYKVFTVPRVVDSKMELKETNQGKALIYRILVIEYDFISSEDGSKITATVIGEGMDSGDKASNKAMSVAHKYAILQVFAVPTEEPKDPENDSHEIVVKKKTAEKEQTKKTVITSADLVKPDKLTKKELDNMVAAFDLVKVPVPDLESFIGKSLGEFDSEDLAKLKPMYSKLKTDQQKREIEAI